MQTTTLAATTVLLFARACIPPGGITDPDRDWLTNGDERDLGTDPHNPDTDGDDLWDNAEVLHGTDPLDPDTDGDETLDGIEIRFGLDPLDPEDGVDPGLGAALETDSQWWTRGDAPFVSFRIQVETYPYVKIIPSDTVPTIECVGTGVELVCIDVGGSVQSQTGVRYSMSAEYWNDAGTPVLRFSLLRFDFSTQEESEYLFSAVPAGTTSP